MHTNRVRQKLADGQTVVGSFMGLGSPSVAELLGYAGFDFLVIETEHNALDSAEIEHMLRAVNCTEAAPLVRIPSSNAVFIQRALDMGAQGIVVPSVKTVAEAQAIVRATRFPPEGARSWGPLRASRYTFDNEDYLKRANDNILVALILETREAVEDMEAIAAVPGIDVLYMGPWDLCLSLGLDPLEMPHSELEDVASRMLATSHTGEVAVGTGASTPDALAARRDQGFTFLTYGPDYMLMTSAARAGLAALGR